MKKSQLTYAQQGDYLLPDLKLPEQPKVTIGVFGQRHKRSLKEHHRLIKATPHNSRRTPCLHIIPSDCPKISPHTSVCELII